MAARVLMTDVASDKSRIADNGFACRALALPTRCRNSASGRSPQECRIAARRALLAPLRRSIALERALQGPCADDLRMVLRRDRRARKTFRTTPSGRPSHASLAA